VHLEVVDSLLGRVDSQSDGGTLALLEVIGDSSGRYQGHKRHKRREAGGEPHLENAGVLLGMREGQEQGGKVACYREAKESGAAERI
jgi:hypothetical protein